MIAAFCLLSGTSFARSLPQHPTPSPSAAQSAEETSLPCDWAPELLDAILSSPNPGASDALYRAAFAAGRAIVPQLKLALKEDRTAEFAAQSLCLIGGDEALATLAKLVDDPRDLNLRRFYYGALAERDTPEANKILLDVIRRSDAEPDRTVSEAAILALSVRTGPELVPELRQLAHKITDVVIRDDLENTLEVIESRARYLASPQGRKPATSIDSAVRTYFAPALRWPSSSAEPALSSESPSTRGPSQRVAERTSRAGPAVKVSTPHIVFSPDHTRALARATFEDPEAVAQYDLVLQNREGAWRVVGAWLGPEYKKPEPEAKSGPPREPGHTAPHHPSPSHPQ